MFRSHPLVPPGVIANLSLGPDESSVFISSNDEGWLVEPGRATRNLLAGVFYRAVWLDPKGSRLLGTRRRSDGNRLVEISATGSGEVRELPTPPGFARLQDVSSDGSRIYIAQGVEQPDADVIHLRIGAIQ